jgi:membrane-bound serine protease (ClpP class)
MASPARAGPTGAVYVIEVSGRVDPIETDFIARSLEAAERDRAELFVIQLDSAGALVSGSQLDLLTFKLTHSEVPVVVWVGPTGSRAHGGATRVLESAGVASMAPGSHVGRTREVPGSLGAEEAKARGIVSMIAPTLGDVIVGVDGQRVGDRVVRTARVVVREGQPRREVTGDVRFAKLGLLERILHAAASPQVAYLLLIVGLLLIVFEFFTAGIGLAGLVGAGSLVLAAYGLAVLPTSALGLGLIVLGFLGFSIDVQAGAPRVWTAIGAAALAVGSWRLFPEGLSVPWFTLVLVVAGVAIFMVAGMRSMIRARFSTPTIGRESMIGRLGEAVTGVDPEGMVRLQGGLWRAHTSRTTPIDAGGPVRVVAIDGLVLEVEPKDPPPKARYDH